jgi:carbamate kinase
VASPEPQKILELHSIRILVELGVIVICVGGGGVPVIRDDHGCFHGVEAVIDKDLSAALLARELEADALLLLTDVDAVETDHGTPRARPLTAVTAAELEALDLPAGSMGPKADAAGRFVRESDGFAAIGALADAPAILAGRAGTRVLADHPRRTDTAMMAART